MKEGYEVHYIILRANKEETMRRAINRSKLDNKTNIELVEVMWEQFHDLETHEVYVLDTTNLSIKDTVLKVKERIATKTALLH